MMPGTSQAQERQPDGKPHAGNNGKAVNQPVVIDCQIKELYLRDLQGRPGHRHPREEEHHHGFYRPFRMW